MGGVECQGDRAEVRARPRPALVPARRLEEWCRLLFFSTDARSGGGGESADRDGAVSDEVGVKDGEEQ